MPFTLCRATVADVDEVAAEFSAPFRLLTFLPMLRTVAEDRSFIANVILKICEVVVAEDAGGIVSFPARHREEVRLFYTRPDRIPRTRLIEAVKSRGQHTRTRCFQANAGARCFYEVRGFCAIRFTGGADNEEKTPDIGYRWERAVAG